MLSLIFVRVPEFSGKGHFPRWIGCPGETLSPVDFTGDINVKSQEHPGCTEPLNRRFHRMFLVDMTRRDSHLGNDEIVISSQNSSSISLIVVTCELSATIGGYKYSFSSFFPRVRKRNILRFAAEPHEGRGSYHGYHAHRQESTL